MCVCVLQMMSKVVGHEWRHYAEETGEDLPGLTASKSRKVAVTTIRESGADRQQQRILARHMAHNVSTADRYYDKSSLFKERRDVLKKLSSMYTVRMAVACLFFRFIIVLFELILKLFFCIIY